MNLQALAAFLPAFRQPDFTAGKMCGGGKLEPGVIELPYASLSPLAVSFVETAYAQGWVLTHFDWPAWARSEEAISLRDDEVAIGNATAEQLARLLTVCIRLDRFSEGALLQRFESGLILRIVERAAALAGELPSTDRP